MGIARCDLITLVFETRKPPTLAAFPYFRPCGARYRRVSLSHVDDWHYRAAERNTRRSYRFFPSFFFFSFFKFASLNFSRGCRRCVQASLTSDQYRILYAVCASFNWTRDNIYMERVIAEIDSNEHRWRMSFWTCEYRACNEEFHRSCHAYPAWQTRRKNGKVVIVIFSTKLLSHYRRNKSESRRKLRFLWKKASRRRDSPHFDRQTLVLERIWHNVSENASVRVWELYDPS